MRLKKLTLFGFKSFPNRTKVEFNRGICAIVGPNGCGKSNVVDAIRWVLGEQSAKMLRARSMDDVIFSGSNGRNISFAEVSLVLENSAGMAPPEFENLSEIEIKRMVSRKGDTRYLINGKNCRLKDIHYLLMDTGAGTRAYSIVDQGQVGQFVEMSPGERRHIIEEVAGISRYKARRVEAERRMADTSRNLERLTDLMSEVERQLRSASRQARKTERYLELRREQELHDKALLKYAWDEQDMVSNHTILGTSDINSTLAQRNNGLVSKGRIPDTFVASSPGNFGVPDGSETVEDDVDDFHNQDTQLSTIDAASTVIDGDYLDKTASINTKVQYASDSSSSADFSTCQNSGNGCAYSNPTVGVGNSTNVKFITTTLTSSNVQDRNIRLRAFMCNIGSVVPQKRMGI